MHRVGLTLSSGDGLLWHPAALKCGAKWLGLRRGRLFSRSGFGAPLLRVDATIPRKGRHDCEKGDLRDPLPPPPTPPPASPCGASQRGTTRNCHRRESTRVTGESRGSCPLSCGTEEVFYARQNTATSFSPPGRLEINDPSDETRQVWGKRGTYFISRVIWSGGGGGSVTREAGPPAFGSGPTDSLVGAGWWWWRTSPRRT